MRPGRRFTLAIVLILTASLGTVAPCYAEGLVIEPPTVDGILPGSTGSFDILLINTNSSGGASYNVASDNLDVSLTGSAGITITSVTTSTMTPYIFAQSIDINYSQTFATISGSLTSFSAFDAADYTAGYPGYQVVAPGQTYGLAEVNYTVSSLAPPGAVDIISLNSINVGTSLSDDQGNLLSFTPVNGALGILFVPEPSSLIQGAMEGLVGLAALAWRRRLWATRSVMLMASGR